MKGIDRHDARKFRLRRVPRVMHRRGAGLGAGDLREKRTEPALTSVPRHATGPGDPLLGRSVCAAGQPARSQVSRCIGLSGSDRKFPPLTGRSGTQRARSGHAHGSGGRRSNLASFAVYLLVLSCWRGMQATSFRTYSGSWVVVLLDRSALGVCARVSGVPRLPPPFPDRRQPREPETGVKPVFACTLTSHFYRWRLACGHRRA